MGKGFARFGLLAHLGRGYLLLLRLSTDGRGRAKLSTLPVTACRMGSFPRRRHGMFQSCGMPLYIPSNRKSIGGLSLAA